MTKNLLPLVVFAVVYGSGVDAAGVTDKYRSESGAECTASYEDNQRFEFGFEGDPNAKDEGGLTIVGKYVYTFGGDKNRSRLNCYTTQKLEEERMTIENERLRLELELLKIQVEAEKNASKDQVTVTDTGSDDDW